MSPSWYRDAADAGMVLAVVALNAVPETDAPQFALELFEQWRASGEPSIVQWMPIRLHGRRGLGPPPSPPKTVDDLDDAQAYALLAMLFRRVNKTSPLVLLFAAQSALLMGRTQQHWKTLAALRDDVAYGRSARNRAQKGGRKTAASKSHETSCTELKIWLKAIRLLDAGVARRELTTRIFEGGGFDLSTRQIRKYLAKFFSPSEQKTELR